jgi:uncharacterized protein YuzE
VAEEEIWLDCDEEGRIRHAHRFVEGTVSGARDADTSNFAHNSAVYVRTFREGGKIIERNGMGGNVCIMYFCGRVKSSKKSVDENFGRNLSSFIIRYIDFLVFALFLS